LIATATKKFEWIGFRHPLDTYFLGREDELAKLQEHQSDERIKVSVISGVGGMGKSLLAFQYAKRKKNSTNCVWLRGEDKDTLLNSLRNLAQKLKLQTNNDNSTQEQFEEMLTSISSKMNDSNQPWLIILDNVDSMHEFVTPTISRLGKEPNLFIIVTSVRRNVTSKRRTAVLMELRGFSDEDADTFINKGLGNTTTSNPKFTRELAKALQNLPLAMNQAAQYIVDQRNKSLKGKAYGIEEFLDEFNNQKNAMEILNYELEENEKTIYTTVKMCSDRIQDLERGEETVTLLHILSYLDPDGVPQSFLEGLIRIAEIAVELIQERLEVLKDYSLISVENKIITINRVVQKIVPFTQFAAVERLLERVAVGTFKSISTSKAFMIFERELRQAVIVWNHFKKVDNLKDGISADFLTIDRFLLNNDLRLIPVQSLGKIFAMIGNILDHKLERLGLVRIFASSTFSKLDSLIQLEISQTGLAALQKALGENHPDVLCEKVNILQSQRIMNMDVNYLEEMHRLIAMAEEKLEKSHPRILNMKLMLAVFLHADKKYTEALGVTKEIRSFVEESGLQYRIVENLEVCCNKALGNVTRASELLEEQTRKLDALMNDTRPTYTNENLIEDKEEDWENEFLNVKERFPELYQLVSESVFNVDNINQKTELCNAFVELKNHLEERLASQSGDGRFEELFKPALSEVTNCLILTCTKFQKFFTRHNFSKAIQILIDFLSFAQL
jgi:hypothetical protein